MSSLFQEMEEFTLFDGLVPSSSGFEPGVEDLDKFDVGFGIPGDSLVKDEYGPGELFEDVLSSGPLEGVFKIRIFVKSKIRTLIKKIKTESI